MKKQTKKHIKKRGGIKKSKRLIKKSDKKAEKKEKKYLKTNKKYDILKSPKEKMI